ncbi:MAG: HAMP domain-containing histidine kinase [Agarilytica sp.]
MNQYLITALIDICLGIFAYKTKENRAAKALAYTALCLGIWSLELFLLTIIQDVTVLSPWFHITRWGLFFIPPCFALLSWQLVGARSRAFFVSVVVPGFLASFALGVTNLFLAPSILTPTESGFLPEIDTVYYAFVCIFLWCFVGSIMLSARCYRSSTRRERQRVKWVVITLLVCFLGGISNIFLMPHDVYLSNYMGSVLNITFVALLFYSTVQHHLMDFRSAISVGISRAILLGFFVWSIFLFTSISGPLSSDSGGFLVLAGLMILMMETYPRLLKWVLPNAKKLLSRDGYDYDRVVIDTSAALNDCVDLRTLTAVGDHLFYQVIRLEEYALLIKGVDSSYGNFKAEAPELFGLLSSKESLLYSDELPKDIGKTLDAKGIGACTPLTYAGECVGVLMLGRASELSYYRYDDVRVFEWLQSELGQAINRINQLDEMQDRLGQAKKTLSMLGVMNHYHHDIKAPLAIIDGVLSNDIYDKEKQKDIVLQQVERGSQLITTMASLLKGERKRKLQAISLSEVVKDSVFLFSQGIDEVNYLFGDTPEIQGDAEDLKILVINVVKNAIEARQDHQNLVVTISTWQSESHVCLSFSDTGVGIPLDRVESLWEENLSSKSSGNGIGMQAIKRIADEHFAVVEVNSEVGSGSEFIFRFPNSIVVSGAIDTQEQDVSDSPFTKSSKVNKPLAG